MCEVTPPHVSENVPESGPPTKIFDMAQISEKSWELPNLWVPDQNPASPRSGWTSGGSGKKLSTHFLRVNPEWTKKSLF